MRNVLRGTLALALAVVGFGLAKGASADTVYTYTVNANFTYDSTSNLLTGTFTYDATMGTITTWDLTVSGTNLAADATYTPLLSGGDSAVIGAYYSPTTNPSYVNFYDFFTGQYIDLDIAGDLADGGNYNLLPGTNGLTYQSSVVCNGCGTLNTSDTNTADDAVATPEPGSLMLLGSGLIGLIGWRKRKA